MNLRRTLFAVIIGLLPYAASASCPDFGLPQTFPAGGNPMSIAVADFNGDGKIDVVVANGLTDNISVLLNNGDKTFGPPTSFAVGDYPYGIAVADFNGDGKADVVVANISSNNVSILLGNGDGTFGAATNFPAGTGAATVAVGDFNADGKADLVVVDQSNPGNVAVMLGNGDGTFGAPTFYSVGTYPGVAAIGDFNGDTKLDLAIANPNTNAIYIFIGSGSGTFSAGTTIAFPPNGAPGTLAAADFNNDGHLDLIGINYSTGVMILPGDGAGGFSAPIAVDTGGLPSALVVTDWNSDGNKDLAVVGYYNQVTTLLGFGDFTFAARRSYLAGSAPYGLAVADFDGDTILDIAAVNYGSSFGGAVYYAGGVTVLFGLGSGAFDSIRGVQVANDDAITETVADFNGDGKPDVAIGRYFGNKVSVFTGNGDATFNTHPENSVGANPYGMTNGDFNGDGFRDIAVANSGDGTVSILIGNGDGTFQPAAPYPTGAGPVAVAVGDFNGDGKVDLAVADYSDSNVAILIGNGNGTFQAPQFFATGAQADDVKIGDFNGDGKLDLAVANYGSNNMSILLGNGNGTFAAAVNYATGPTPYTLSLGDFNADGKIDIAVPNYDYYTYPPAPTISIMIGNGDGTFTKLVDYPSGSAFGIAVADFDGDGNLDLAADQENGGLLAVYRGHGDGTFAPAVRNAMSGNVADIVASDINGDGRMDLVTANAFNNNFTVLLNHTGDPLRITTARSVPVGATGITASVPRRIGSTYTWTLTGGTITSGQGTASIQYSAGTPGTRMTLSVSESSASLCAPVNGTTRNLVDFLDVPPSHLFHDFVVTLALNGITGGCGGGNYCVNDSVLRSQMAVFLLRGEHGEAYAPPAAVGIFSDVPSPSFFADFIERLYNEGITGGCATNPLRYCPGNPVLRSQMAIFLLRAEHGAAYNPPPATGIFQDVPPGSFAANFIEQLFYENITGGCSVSPPLYCPNDSTTRGAMAVFLVRTFNLQ